MLAKAIRERAEEAIKGNVFPGCVVGIACADGSRAIILAGTLDGRTPVRENTIYDVASITKSIPLAGLALTLIAEHPARLHLADKVVDHLPELQNDYGATIEDLLRYRVTGTRMSSLKATTFEEIRTHVFEHGFDRPAGNGAYTNLPAFLIGLVLERISGESLPALAHKYFFEPLNMSDTTFFPKVTDASISTGRQILMRTDNRIAPTEIADGVEVRGIVHDESARVFARARRAVGHAGLFSTAPDLLKFLEALLNGKYPAVVDGAQKGLGWEACPNREGWVDRAWMGKHRTSTTFGKTGFTGTSVLVDINRGIGLVILSNRTYPYRPADNSAINLFRKEIADIVLR